MKNRSFLRRLIIANILIFFVSALAFGQKSANTPLHEIPFEFELDKVIVPVTVNGKKTVRLILDTGMPEGIFLMKPEAAVDMELNYVEANVMLRGAGAGTSSAKMAMGAEYKLAGIAFTDQRVIVVNEEGPLSRTEWDGAVGASVFNRFVVEIDLEKEMLKLYDPQAFDAGMAGDAIELTFTRTKPYIKASLNVEGEKEVPILALIDTGAGAGLVISTARGWVAPANSIDAVLGGGIGGDVEGAVARAYSLSVGAARLKDIIVYFNRGEMPGDQEALIGMRVLNRFHVTFDYTAKKMYLRPNRHFGEPFEFNMTGLAVRPEKDGTLKVVDVVEGSPAYEAGVKTGDNVVSINGKKVSYSGFARIIEDIRKPGIKIEIEFSREGKTFSRSLVSRRLL